MEFAMSLGEPVIHTRRDWPCAVCRPCGISAGRGYCLCLDCAYVVVAAAGAGGEGAQALLDDITDIEFVRTSARLV
jgi:hypothetical protein